MSMLVVSVIAHDGMSNMEPLRAEFDEAGGSIGRGDANKLILSDPERRISRIHAIIVYQNGQYVIQDRGTATPIQLNGRVIGQGNELPINSGDELSIGGYMLAVSNNSGGQDAITQINLSNEAHIFKQDNPLNLFGDNNSSEDPFADLMGSNDDPLGLKTKSTNEHANFIHSSGSLSSSTYEKLPDDFVLGPISSNSNGPSISKLFDLNEEDNNSNLLDLNSESNGLLDLLLPADEVCGKSSKSSYSSPVSDHVPEINGYFKPPQVLNADDVQGEQKSQQDSNMVLSWEQKDESGEEIKTMIIKGRPKVIEPEISEERHKQGKDTATSQPLNKLAGKGTSSVNKDIPNQPIAQKSQPVYKTDSVNDAELLKAFLTGTGMPDLQIPEGLTPEKMQRLGMIFRTMVQGTLDLLLARATIKQEVRAEMTMIIARENNPLKFSPNVEAALTHLLSQSQKGFMEPLAAIEDAYDDLRTHQFGFMAGMRAALKDVLLRFNPERLERRLEERNVIDTLLPMSRKARLWNLFENLYGDISKEAEDDFHALFGKEFVRAYEEQIKKLDQEKNKI